jgi:hypothetical protein
MELLDMLARKASDQTEPLVWVSRLAIYRTIHDGPDLIRTIPLERGVNIIWARELDEVSIDEVEVAGHSAGKTTFCRLLRYCLGEAAFANKSLRQLIRKSFPGGYVAADVHLAGEVWAVARPIGNSHVSYARKACGIDDLFSDRPSTDSYQAFLNELGKKTTHGLRTATVVRSNEPIQWDHMLAWCSRDQEARYQELWQWRSPRSDSETPALERPKADGLFVMGTILDLFDQKELLLEERLSELSRDIQGLKDRIEQRRREVVYWRNHYDKKLRGLLDIDAGEDVPLKGGGLYTKNFTDLVAEALPDVADGLNGVRSEIRAEQRRIAGLEYRIQGMRGQLEKLKASHAQDVAASIEIDSGLMERAKARRDLDQLGEEICTYGDVAFRDCSHIAQRRASLSFVEAQDELSLGQAKATREDRLVALQEKVDAVQAELRKLIEERDSLLQAKQDLIKREDTLRRKRDDLEESLRELSRWDAAATNGGSDDPIIALRDTLEELETEENAADTELTSLLDGADEARDLLSNLFDQSAKTVLSPAYSGAVSFSGRELSFSLKHGPALAGEAMQTLSILIADVSCILFRVLGYGHLPCFLVHDSPREADLDPRIYESFQLFLTSLNDACGGEHSCPFQYIMTTTTPPPKAVQDRFVRDTIDARSENEMLLRKNVARIENGGLLE